MQIYWRKEVVQIKPETHEELIALDALVECLNAIKFGHVEPSGPGQV